MKNSSGRGFAPEYVLFDAWDASLENLKQVPDFGWHWQPRLRGDSVVIPVNRAARPRPQTRAPWAVTVVRPCTPIEFPMSWVSDWKEISAEPVMWSTVAVALRDRLDRCTPVARALMLVISYWPDFTSLAPRVAAPLPRRR